MDHFEGEMDKRFEQQRLMAEVGASIIQASLEATKQVEERKSVSMKRRLTVQLILLTSPLALWKVFDWSSGRLLSRSPFHA
jgi:ATP-dependent RNA circularization protein (DNA/RNA ligase family)